MVGLFICFVRPEKKTCLLRFVYGLSTVLELGRRQRMAGEKIVVVLQ